MQWKYLFPDIWKYLYKVKIPNGKENFQKIFSPSAFLEIAHFNGKLILLISMFYKIALFLSLFNIDYCSISPSNIKYEGEINNHLESV